MNWFCRLGRYLMLIYERPLKAGSPKEIFYKPCLGLIGCVEQRIILYNKESDQPDFILPYSVAGE